MICFIASVDAPAWAQEFISFYRPTRSAGRHGNLRRLKTWTRTDIFETQSCVGPHDRRASGRRVDEPDLPAIEYQGYRIRPTPYRTERQYQTAGIIEKNFPDGPKQHRFVRADTPHSKGPAPLRHRTRQNSGFMGTPVAL